VEEAKVTKTYCIFLFLATGNTYFKFFGNILFNVKKIMYMKCFVGMKLNDKWDKIGIFVGVKV